MFLAAIGRTDAEARLAVDEISAHVRHAGLSCSVHEGVAIACWEGAGLERSVFAGDHAYVGTVRGEFPRPGVELRGDFALVARSGSGLRLARARFAGRPLYWTRTGSVVAACSRLLPLLILAGRETRINLEHVLALFDARFMAMNAPLPFVGAERVRPNTVVDVTATGPATTHVGPLREEPELPLSTRGLADALREELEAAVARECAGTHGIAVLAGGGVDSSNLLAVAVRNARRVGLAEPIPLALDYGGEGDDRPHLRAVCRHLGIEPLRVAPAEGAPYAGQERVVDGAVQGTAPSSTVIAAMVRAKAAGAERVLSGEGSEWILDSAPAVFGDFLLRHPTSAIWCAWRFRSSYETRPQTWRRLVFGPGLRLVIPTRLLDQRRRYIDQRTGLANSRTLGWAGPRLRAFLTARRDCPSPPPIQSQHDRVAQLASSALPVLLRESCSRWEIAGGLPMSFPYLDDDFLRFVARIPSAAIFAGHRERGLLRESMENLVPDSVRYRTDKARPYRAFADLFRAVGGRDSVKDLITMRELEGLGIVDAERFNTAFDRFAADPDADASCWWTLWPAITSEAYIRWFKAFTAGTGRQTLTHLAAMAPS